MTDLQVRHLELIQGVATRFGTNSFLIKGWCLTVSGALCGYTIKHLTWKSAVVAMFPTLPFWFFDLIDDTRKQMLYNKTRKAAR